MKPSVLMFCPQFRPFVGGAERQAERLARALVARGARVKILTPKLIAGTPAFEEDSGVIVHRFPLFDLKRIMPWLRGVGPLNLLLIRLQVMRAVERHLDGTDVLHAHIACPASAFAMLAAQRKGVPVLCKVAMTGDRSDLGELSAVRGGGSSLARKMVNRLDRWVATTRAVSETLSSRGVPAGRISSIPNGVPIAERPTWAEGRHHAMRFLYLGRLSSTAQRDVPGLIRAFERLADAMPDAELALVGDGDLFEETARIVSGCRHRDRIRMPGTQDPDPWLAWADVFVLPSRREGLSNALLEAMASGLACIANDIPPNREVLDDGAAGDLVPVEDENALYQAMSRVARDSAWLRGMGEAAFRRVRDHYSMDSVAERYLALYDELMRGRG